VRVRANSAPGGSPVYLGLDADIDKVLAKVGRHF
jgi:hypothetical protein